MKFPLIAPLAVFLFLFGPLPGQTPPAAAAPDPTAGVSYDPEIPTLASLLGHEVGAEISTHADVARAIDGLAKASRRVRVFTYGSSWEKRSLVCAVVGTEARLAELDTIREGMGQLANPRDLQTEVAETLVSKLPAVAWLANCVHGDEPSGTDAALMLLYHLLAAQNDPTVERILDECLVIIDPIQNPDGRDRFCHSTRAARGRFPDAHALAAEHTQPWPGGRVNHALFDMNRDWFALSQPETQARVRAFQEWWPLVYVDLHEMGGNSTYYFPPPADPVHEEITPAQRASLKRYGQNAAAWFDRFGYEYFTREAFDSFYPGYGDGWPTFQGSIGMTFEAASSRGLIYERRDESILRYKDCVDRHFAASMATLETLSSRREAALREFLEYRRNGLLRGTEGPVHHYLFPPRGDRTRLARLMNLLMDQGIEVHQATGDLAVNASVLGASEVSESTFPKGTYVVPMTQAASTLATVLLKPHFDMDPLFLEEQKRREQRRQGTEFYDLTAWALPLLFGVETWTATTPITGEHVRLERAGANSGAPPLRTEPPKVAYVLPWGQNGSAALLAGLLRMEIRVRSIDRPFRVAETSFPAGSCVLRIQDMPENFHATLQRLASLHGVTPVCVDSSWVDDGPNFGTNRSHVLKTPRVAMAWDRPVQANSAGWLRYLLEWRYGIAVTPLRTQQIAQADLDRFTVLILPEGGGYDGVLGGGGAEAIKGFVRRGGVLITLGSATRWLTSKNVDLLSSEPESRTKPKDDKKTSPAKKGEAPESTPGESKPSEAEAKQPSEEKKPDGEEEPFDYKKAILPDKESPPSVPGAILRVTLDPDHWLAFGYDGSASVLHDSSNVYTPIKLDQGTNIAIYAEKERLVLAGFVWEEMTKQLPGKAYLVHQPFGQGHVIAFAEDPNVRAFADGLNLLLLNGVLLTAGR